ncbi:hypothetical protein NL676_036840 [Syzygium grande]|nr:hypothetical protein NL676_036840 [Syzygium grande]
MFVSRFGVRAEVFDFSTCSSFSPPRIGSCRALLLRSSSLARSLAPAAWLESEGGKLPTGGVSSLVCRVVLASDLAPPLFILARVLWVRDCPLGTRTGIERSGSTCRGCSGTRFDPSWSSPSVVVISDFEEEEEKQPEAKPSASSSAAAEFSVRLDPSSPLGFIEEAFEFTQPNDGILTGFFSEKCSEAIPTIVGFLCSLEIMGSNMILMHCLSCSYLEIHPEMDFSRAKTA